MIFSFKKVPQLLKYLKIGMDKCKTDPTSVGKGKFNQSTHNTLHGANGMDPNQTKAGEENANSSVLNHTPIPL